MSKHSRTDTELTVEQDIRPCRHMEDMVSAYADGSLRGPVRWYTQLHTLHCMNCRAAVKHLRVVIDKVAGLREEEDTRAERIPANRRAELERALDDVDGSAQSKG